MMTSTPSHFFGPARRRPYLAMLQKLFSAEALEGYFNQKMEKEVANRPGSQKG